MRAIPLLAALGLSLGLSLGLAGCGAPAPLHGGPALPAPVDAPYTVTAVTVTAPATLSVSEANLIYPIGDIVWRGDPRGDRRAQVAALLTEALERGTAGLAGPRAVRLEAQVLRFHALSEKARLTFGGVYNVELMLTLRDAATGQIVEGPRRFESDTRASGGQRAMEEEARGLTQRVVIVDALAAAIRADLAAPRPQQAPAAAR